MLAADGRGDDGCAVFWLFPLLFQASAYANMTVKQQQEVTSIMRTELDRIAENEYARKEGVKQGREQGREEGREEEKKVMAKRLRDLGVDPQIIQEATGLTREEIKAL